MPNLNFNFGIPVGSPTSTAYSGYASGVTIAVVLGGTVIPLTTSYINGMTYSGGVVTIPTAGTYYVDYRVSTTASLALSASIFKNGTSITALVSNPGVAATQFRGTGIISCNAGDTLSLELYGLLGSAVLTGGAGATLNIIRIA